MQKAKSLTKSLLVGGAALVLLAPLALSPVASKVMPNSTITVQAKRRHHHHHRSSWRHYEWRISHPMESFGRAERRFAHHHHHHHAHHHYRHHRHHRR